MSGLPKKVSDKMVALVASSLAIVFVIGIFFSMEHQDNAWDQKIKELCEKDGGLKVLEIAHISPGIYKNLINNKGEVSILPKATAAIDTPFFTETVEMVLYSQPRFSGIRRIETKYIQRKGNKILATNVHYESRGVNNAYDRPVFFGKCQAPNDGVSKQFIQVQGGG